MRVRFSSWFLRPVVWLLLPVAWWWARRHEQKILNSGQKLTEQEKVDAAAAGVVDVDSIRLRIISPVPTPGGALLRRASRITRFPLNPPSGMALGHGIYLDPSVVSERYVFLHECVHVAQYERMGGIWPFLDRYLLECLQDTYWNAAMEAEANEVATRICGRAE